MFFTEIPRLFPQDFHRGDFGASGRKDGKIWKKGLIFGGRAGIIRLSTLFLERFFDFFLYREAALFFCSFFFTAAAVCFSTAHRRLKAVVFSLREGYNSFRTRGPFPNARRGCAPSSALLPMYGRSAPPPRVTFPSRGKSPKARQGLRPLESPWDSAKLWEPDEVRFEGWNAKPIELKAITIPYRPFRARCASRRATLCYEPSPICHFELVGQPVFISPQATPGGAPPAVNPWRGRWVWLLRAARSGTPFWGEQQAHTCARCWGDDNVPQGEYPEGVAPLGDSLVTFSSGRKSPGCRAERLHHGWSAEEGRTSGAPLLAKGRNPRQRKKKN